MVLPPPFACLQRCSLPYAQSEQLGLRSMYVNRLSFPPVAVIGFVQTTYTVNEVQGMNSEIDVCVHLLTGTIAPGLSVDYSLEYIDEDADQGMLRCGVVWFWTDI